MPNPPPPRIKWTRRVPSPVPIGHAPPSPSLPPLHSGAHGRCPPRSAARASGTCAPLHRTGGLRRCEGGGVTPPCRPVTRAMGWVARRCRDAGQAGVDPWVHDAAVRGRSSGAARRPRDRLRHHLTHPDALPGRAPSRMLWRPPPPSLLLPQPVSLLYTHSRVWEGVAAVVDRVAFLSHLAQARCATRLPP